MQFYIHYYSRSAVIVPLSTRPRYISGLINWNSLVSHFISTVLITANVFFFFFTNLYVLCFSCDLRWNILSQSALLAWTWWNRWSGLPKVTSCSTNKRIYPLTAGPSRVVSMRRSARALLSFNSIETGLYTPKDCDQRLCSDLKDWWRDLRWWFTSKKILKYCSLEWCA